MTITNKKLIASLAAFGLLSAVATTALADDVVLTVDAPDSGTIESLQVDLVFDSATYWDNLTVELSHADVSVILMNLGTDNCSGVAILNARFEDGGGDLGAVPCVSDPNQIIVAPTGGLLSAFTGLPVGGEWTLRIFDDVVPGDGTDLASFNIHVDLVGLDGITIEGPTAEDVDQPPTIIIEPVPTLSAYGLALIMLGTLLIAFRRFRFARRPW